MRKGREIMKKRAFSLFIAITLMFCLSSWRIYDLCRGTDTAVFGQQMNYKLTITEPRGNIYDRNLVKLVGNQSRYMAAVAPNISTINEINKKLGSSAEDALELLKSGTPVVIEATSDFEADESLVFSVPVRYSSDQIAAHLIGYTDSTGHGVTGIEYAYDKLLSSEDAVTVTYTVDASGRSLSGIEPVVSGTTDIKTGVVLTLDSAVQKLVEQAAPSLNSGVVVVMDVSNGDIIALASVPDYSPLNVAASLENTESPLINRALSAYNVGSVFKVLVAAAAVDSGVSTSFTYHCSGKISIGQNTFNCHQLSGHGGVNMTDALCVSCNPYFITLGKTVGADRLLTLCRKLGFGNSRELASGIFAAAGTLPEQSVIEAQPAALANFSFGQGQLLLTPIDIAVMTAMAANGGYAVTPRIVSGIMMSDGKISQYMSESPRRVISELAAERVKNMMCAVVSDGTGSPAMPEQKGAGGKTATAEAGYKVDGKKVNQCWFSGFYPAENPRFAITVLGENGISGATTAAPVFKRVCDGLTALGY